MSESFAERRLLKLARMLVEKLTEKGGSLTLARCRVVHTHTVRKMATENTMLLI